MAFSDRTLPVVMQLTRLLNSSRVYDRRGHDVASDHFTAGDMQTLNVVAEFPERNTSALAELIGVTKGAVSQSVGKLVERGYLERYRKDGNERETFTRLTKQGQRAYRAQLKRFEADIQSIDAFLAAARPGEVAFLLAFLRRADAFFRERAAADDS